MMTSIKRLGQRTLTAIAITAVSFIPLNSHAESCSYTEFKNNPEISRRVIDNLLDYAHQFIPKYSVTEDAGDGDIVFATYTPKKTSIIPSPVYIPKIPDIPIKPDEELDEKIFERETYTPNGPMVKLRNTLSNFANYSIDEINKDIRGLDNRFFRVLAFVNDSKSGIWNTNNGFLEYHPELTKGNEDYEKYIGRIAGEAFLEQFANSELGKSLLSIAKVSTIELEKKADNGRNGISSFRENVERKEEIRRRKRTATTFSANRFLGLPFGEESKVNLAYNLIDIDDDERISYFGKAELDIEHGKLFGIPIFPIDRGEIEFTPSTRELAVSYQKSVRSKWPLAFKVKWENDGKLNGENMFNERNSWLVGLSFHSKEDKKGLWQLDIGTKENQLVFAQMSGLF